MAEADNGGGTAETGLAEADNGGGIAGSRLAKADRQKNKIERRNGDGVTE